MTFDLLPDRIASKIDIDEASGCWRWTASHNNGYAFMWWQAEGRNNAYVHRIIYHLLVDPTCPIGGGGKLDTIDHVAAICTHRPDCVNPAHMERVSCRINSARSKMRPTNTSQFIGVSQHRNSHRWNASIVIDGRKHRIGTFDTEADAARAYDAACVAIGEQPLNDAHGLLDGTTPARAAFTVDEVAALYAVSPALVRQLVAAETLAKVPHLGRAVRISWDELKRVFGPLPKDVAA